ncbi:hypothetical protein [Massilia sp. Root335]|uniref:hypothetical protein n=1 Tax=Massilia sp. Root335 TaxID=1736517 RepID=UPI00071299A5|nr:hypothetical protein [Massilia sp. Root335]KQV42604.1 hypothetical protein ASC93_16225 [Massilia sp. Root335]
MLHRFVHRFCTFALACTAALSIAHTTPAVAQPIIDEGLSADCSKGLKGPVVKPTSDSKITHQYMLLLVFKKGTGSKYFGNPKPGQYGCIPNADGKHDADGKLHVEATGTQLMVATCPNDCSYPLGKHEAMNDGADPLGLNAWGIASAVDSAPPGGGPDRHIEVWEVPVFNACHARSLYAFSTEKGSGLLTHAYAAGDMLGEMLVGYRSGEHGMPIFTCP